MQKQPNKYINYNRKKKSSQKYFLKNDLKELFILESSFKKQKKTQINV